MKIEISIGDAIDKLTILEIKKKYINDITKIEEITKEIEVLSVCDKYKNDYIFFYNLLVYVNQKIWDLTNTVKSMDIDNPQLVNFLQGIRPQIPQEIQPKIDDLTNYYQKK